VELRGLLTNIRLLVIIAILIVANSINSSYQDNDWLWFGRSGAWVTLIGVILGARTLIRMGVSGWIQSQKVIDCGSLDPSAEEREADDQRTEDSSAFTIGVVMSILGTLIWAYGDLADDFLKALT